MVWAMKRIGLPLLSAVVAFAVCTFAATNDFRATAIAVQGNDVRVTWQCTGPSNFVLEASSTVTGAWSTVDYASVSSPTLTSTNLVDFGGATNGPVRFYRVRLLRLS
jgi:hypothetical protein